MSGRLSGLVASGLVAVSLCAAWEYPENREEDPSVSATIEDSPLIPDHIKHLAGKVGLLDVQFTATISDMQQLTAPSSQPNSNNPVVSKPGEKLLQSSDEGKKDTRTPAEVWSDHFKTAYGHNGECSAFMIGSMVLSAAHCDLYGLGALTMPGPLTSYNYIASNGDQWPVQDVILGGRTSITVNEGREGKFGPGDDTLTGYINEAQPEGFTIGSPDDLANGEMVYMIGHPGAEQEQIQINSGRIDKTPMAACAQIGAQGAIRRDTISSLSRTYLIARLPAGENSPPPGMSGGPVLDSDGNAVGTISGVMRAQKLPANKIKRVIAEKVLRRKAGTFHRVCISKLPERLSKNTVLTV